MRRRSTRLHAKPSQTYLDGDSDPGGDNFRPSENEEDSAPPPRKRRKTTHRSSLGGNQLAKDENFDPKWRHTKGRRGLLKRLAMEAPLDIMFEVFSHCEPPDLLALSRSSKDIRALLLNRAFPGTEALWASAREAIPNIPEKPDEISEPEFAALLFDKHCMECDSPKVSNFAYRKRLCRSCFEHLTVRDGHGARQFILDQGKVVTILDGSDRIDLSSIIPRYSIYKGYRHHNVYFTQELQNIVNEYNVLPEDGKEAWVTLQKDATARKNKARSDHSMALGENKARSGELQNLKQERYSQIVARLEALGYKNEIKGMDRPTRLQLRNHKHVDKSQLLTDRIWGNIRSELVDFMDVVRISQNHRRSIEHTRFRLQILIKARDRYKLTAGPNLLVPPVSELATMPQFLDIIGKDILENKISEDAFDTLFGDEFPSVCDEWLQQHLRSLLASPEENCLSQDRLHLATTHIACSCCTSRMRYPTALFHVCTTIIGHPLPTSPTLLPPKDRVLHALYARPHSLKLEVSPAAELGIRLCGLDPSTTTYEDMMQLNPLFECEVCPGANDQYHVLLNFPEVVEHKHTFIRLISETERIDLDIPKTTFLPGPASYRESGIYAKALRCRLCTKRLQRQEIHDHMSSSHQIDIPVVDTHYVLDFEVAEVGWKRINVWWSKRGQLGFADYSEEDSDDMY
ncbi:hypothetical protein DL96DRAFT_1629958 [Flagelloscypha sp. PMI_526]|nr:hypothetical protein DL96DRAFT_1629958 [Flagelloscypha sp. PMI_526]